jgi:arsenate reductase-like glutaredoxin family protein
MIKKKQTKKSPTLTIYCEGWCNYLRKIADALMEKNISFKYVDLRFDKPKFEKLSSKIGSPLPLPILEINGTYFKKPAYITITKLLKQSAWENGIDNLLYGSSPNQKV